jgi:hypothetical protein
MVESIQGYNGGLNELQAGQLNQNQQVERVNQESAGGQKSADVISLFDKADISDAAMQKLDAERDLIKFASLAQRMDEPYNEGKVSYFKDLLDSGRINDYLRGLSNNDLADSMTKSPLGVSFA